MNNTVNIGRLYFCIALQAAGAPLVDRAITREEEGRLRRGMGYLIRPPFTGHRPVRGLNVGVWAK